MEQSRAAAFLRGINMHPEQLDLDRGTRDFLIWMQRGLEGEDEQALPMLPAFASSLPGGELRGRCCVVDAGGTNLRAYLVEFSGGEPQVLDSAHASMPGREGPESFEGYCCKVARLALPFYRRAQALGYCFSFPAAALPSGDAALLGFNKEVEIAAPKGRLLCRSLTAALLGLGAPELPFSLVNDSVAAMLAAPAVTGQPMERCAGFILGTGLNLCYAERAERIKKSPEASAAGGTMAVNTESACFGGFPRGEGDQALDAASACPGDHPLEKAASGAYLGPLVLETLNLAAGRGLLSPSGERALAELTELPTTAVSALCGEEELPGLCGEDAGLVREVCRLLAERAARAAALPILAARESSCPGQELLVSAEGSVVRRFAHLRGCLDRLLQGRARLLEIENATAIGAAAAAITRSMSAAR